MGWWIKVPRHHDNRLLQQSVPVEAVVSTWSAVECGFRQNLAWGARE